MGSTKCYDQRPCTCERNKCERYHACTLQHEDCRGFVRWDIAWSFDFTIMQRTCRCTEQDARSDKNTDGRRECMRCIHERWPFFKNRSSTNIKTRHHRTMVVVSMVLFVCATIGCPALAAAVRWGLLLCAVFEAVGFDIVARFVSHRQASSA